MNGTDVIDIAKDHIGESYILGARAILSNKHHKGPWDCAEFTSWCTYQAYNKVFGAYGTNPGKADPYSGKWYEDAKKKKCALSIDDALGTPGAFLIRKPGDHNLKIGHVAISLGNGSTIEARSKKYGVGIFSKAASRPWTIGCVIPGVDYANGSVAYTPDDRLLRLANPFMQGEAVLKLQQRLHDLGYSVGTLDGVFGPATEAAVSNFQAVTGLAHDGIVGPDTAEALGLSWPI